MHGNHTTSDLEFAFGDFHVKRRLDEQIVAQNALQQELVAVSVHCGEPSMGGKLPGNAAGADQYEAPQSSASNCSLVV